VPESSNPLGTILGVWGHPDDETYLSAGLMARAVGAGDRVVCVTATRGEEGSFDEERWPTEAMGEVREAELMRSLEIVGVTEHHWLDYHDGTCADADQEDAIARVTALVQEVRPDTVITFGPDGMTGHPDHKSVCAWATAAFRAAAPEGARLCYATYTPEWAERWAPVFNRFNVFMEPGTPPVTPREELEICFELSPGQIEDKLRAIEAHVSQVEGMIQAFGPDVFREAGAAEYFLLAETKEEDG